MSDAAPKRFRLSLLSKLCLLSVGLVLLTTGGLGGYLVHKQRKDVHDELLDEAASMVTLIAEVGRDSIAAGNKESTRQLLHTLKLDADIAYVEFLDSKRRAIASRTVTSPPPTLADAIATQSSEIVYKTEAATDGTRVLDVLIPIYREAAADSNPAAGPAVNSAPLGYARIGMRFDMHEQRLTNYLFGLASVSAFLILLSVVLAFFFTRRLVAPMRRLTRAAKLIGEGQLGVRVPVTTHDELAELTVAFNYMTTKLSEAQASVRIYQRQLEENQRTLEDKVTQRTNELQAATTRAHRMAQHDILTGLPNRALLNARLKDIVANAHTDHRQVGVLFIDFDFFKRVNDSYGHDAGDHFLQGIAQRLTQTVRENDLVARLGGDEFVVVLADLDPTHTMQLILDVVQRVHSAFEEPFPVGGSNETVTCSIGIALYPDDAVDPAGLIKQADAAMYTAKEQGRNTYRFFTADISARVQARAQLENSLRRALANNEFFLVYQPQVDIGTGLPVGAETLLRWRDPQRGIISPAEFIPAAEECGLIHPLGAWVLQHACHQARQWHDDDLPLRLSVNLSVHQLEHDDWLMLVEQALSDSGLPPRYLDLEITESVIISNPEKAVATLLKIKNMGVTITMDDFGTGYSSLNYLTRLPLHNVKIDQKFVRGLEHDHNDAMITQAIIALSHSLGMRVIAEGVETPGQYRFLHGHGCEEAQGFYISQPLEPEALRKWWNERLEMSSALRPMI